MRLTLLAFAALFISGCAKHLANPIDGDPFNTPTGPQTVYIWNGKTCVEATRTPQQLRKTEILKTASMQNGEMKALQVYAEDVPPPVMRKLFMEGGTIVLPNGEKMVFPAGSARGTTVVQNGKIPAGNGEAVHADAPPGLEAVYVWNGRECVEAMLTPEEQRKRKMFQLKSFVMRDGQTQEITLWVERVDPKAVNKMLAEGGSIRLPNGERLEIPVQRTIAVVENGRVPLGNGESIGVEGVPDGTQLTLKKQYVTKSGVLVADVDLADPALSPPESDKSEWWTSPAAMDAAAKDAIKVPAASSTQGRVGYAGVSYGMGQIKK